ncbi:MAG: serine protease, partial [Nitrososphaeraceae archaeon]|nr:serine protease [Nitrososphaeraceae archaeon]
MTNEFKIGYIGKVIVILIGAAIIVSSSSILIFPLQSTMEQQQQQPSSSSKSTSSLPGVFKRVENSVVQITTTQSNPNNLIIINGVPATGKSTALGSGFVYDNQGHIITNYHVIDGATTADVSFTDGNTYS